MHFRTVYFIPAILSSLIVGLIFNALFGGRHGVIDSMLASVGLENLSLPWLGERWPAVFASVLQKSGEAWEPLWSSHWRACSLCRIHTRSSEGGRSYRMAAFSKYYSSVNYADSKCKTFCLV